MKNHLSGIFFGRPGSGIPFAGVRLALCALSVVVLPQRAATVPPGTFNHRIAVDQFGYLPDMVKVAVISNPQKGFNAAEHYTPGNTLEVRTWNSQAVVFAGAP